MLFTLLLDAYRNAYFGIGTGPIHIDDVSCMGSESRLIDCSYDTSTSGDSHYEDAGVRCFTCKCGLPLSVANPDI